MARYFFNVLDGFDLEDDEGLELPDLAAARRAAADFIGAVIRDEGAALFNDREFGLNVTDERGLVLFTVHVIFLETAATKGWGDEGKRSAAA